MPRVISALAAAVLAAACKTPRSAGPPPRVIIHGANGPAAVDVELAKSDGARARGLMFRTSLALDTGMLFLFEGDENRTFWMRNTLLPLDMIFIAGDLTVAGIVADATPQTDTARTIGRPSRYVLEVNAGWAAAHGVRPGDRVEIMGL